MADVRAFWKSQSFDLGLKDYEGNCDLCFLKKWWKRVRLVQDKPERVNWWIQQEKNFKAKTHGDGRYFRKGEPYQAVKNSANHPEFPIIASVDDDIPCGCTIGVMSDKTENCAV